MKSLVLWEFSRKQNYVFKSNKLKECIGASMIIRKLSEEFNEYNFKAENFIIKGGGKSLYLFDDEKQADKFIRDFSIKIIKSYPGLELFIVKETVDLSNDDIKVAIKDIYRKLEVKKSSRKNSGNQIGFGIERQCDSTGYPASSHFCEDGIKKFISSEINAKRDEEENNVKEYFDDLIPEGYKYSKEIVDLVNEKGKSYIAVIHIDGNGMGKKLRYLESKIVKKSGETTEDYNKRYVDIIRKFSQKIDESYKSAFKSMSEKVADSREELKDVSKISDNIIPLRPLIFAGDDVTYLSNAYIGVETAEIFLKELEKNIVEIDDTSLKLYACAGIAVIKKGYPFIKGYGAAEQLCENSKKTIFEREYEDTSVLDFHIYQGDVNKSIYDIRKDEYSFDGEHIKLTMKPLVLDPSVDWRNYENFITSLENIRKAVDDKKIGRNKVKALREVLKKGEDETKYFLKFYNITPGKYFRDFRGSRGDYCFNESDSICMYLDAIETMDMFRELKK